MDKKTLKEITQDEIQGIMRDRLDKDDQQRNPNESAALAGHISNWLRLDDLVPETDAEALWIEIRALIRGHGQITRDNRVLLAIIRMLCVAGINEQEDLLEDARALFAPDDAQRDVAMIEDFLREAIGKLKIHGAGFKGEKLVNRVAELLAQSEKNRRASVDDATDIAQRLDEVTEKLSEVEVGVAAKDMLAQKQSVST